MLHVSIRIRWYGQMFRLRCLNYMLMLGIDVSVVLGLCLMLGLVFGLVLGYVKC